MLDNAAIPTIRVKIKDVNEASVELVRDFAESFLPTFAERKEIYKRWLNSLNY